MKAVSAQGPRADLEQTNGYVARGTYGQGAELDAPPAPGVGEGGGGAWSDRVSFMEYSWSSGICFFLCFEGGAIK